MKDGINTKAEGMKRQTQRGERATERERKRGKNGETGRRERTLWWVFWR